MKAATKPIIGILAIEGEKGFRGNQKNFRDLIQEGRSRGIQVYVFTPSKVNWAANTIEGFYYDAGKKRWDTSRFQLPDVIYNRIPYRENEAKPEVQKFLQTMLSHPEISMFNPSFFDKGKLFESLNRVPQVQPYLPETKPLRQIGDLHELLAKYPFVYLKPVAGKAGMGILRVERRPDGTFTQYAQAESGSKQFHYQQLADCWQALQPQLRQQSYLVQQGITINSIHGRPFDLRVLVQKNGDGKWEISGVGARIAGQNSITTHVPRGGAIGRPEKLLQRLFGESSTEVLNRVKKAALLLAQSIEQQNPHSLGEMSMDFGVDKEGRAWFFEANAKPMKFDEPHIRKKSLSRIIDYSLYLFNKKRNGSIRV